MSAHPAPASLRRISVVRALVALVWAVAFVLAVGHRVPTTDADVPVLAALLLTAYPLIDVVASLAAARLHPAQPLVLRAGAAVSAAAAVGIAATAFGADAGAALAAFGIWAAVSGAMQFVVAVRGSRQASMLVSGGLSTIAGLGFLSAAGMDDAHLANLAGYMALGAVLFLVSARPGRATAPAAS